MSNTPVQEPPAQRLSSGSGQTLPFRPLQPFSDASASKRVCFYKSGDYKFSGHRMVITARTFKTFDALLDALSKKVPLPFGVRTITTPRGTHLVKGLDDLHDGGSYVCSDQKRVKPLNLDEVNRRQVPWNTTRPLSAGRRQRRQGLQFGRKNEVNNRSAKVTERVAVRTPKRLLIIKNKDPTVKRTIVLQRRTAPTFDALLDYLSQILQFSVLKLYSTEGRRVDGLASLILCSGVVVAAGNEPFRLGNYGFHKTGQMAQAMYMETLEPSMLQPRAQNSKSFLSGRGSRNFSLSSEQYIVNQINKSRNGSMNSHLNHDNGSHETEANPCHTSTGRLDAEHPTCVVPQDDDIEKSFRVNQDGSMTVEMKVRLTIKEEEMLHWTTTLSRSSLSKRTVCASISESGNSTPNSNAIAKDCSMSEGETKEENYPAGAGKGVGFKDEQIYEGYSSTALGKEKSSFKRTCTPGPRYVKKKASVENVKMVTESGVQENTLGHYSYMERTADGGSAEGYCVVRHNSSSNRPVPKPRKSASAGASNKGSHSFTRSSGVAEVLQIQNDGMEVTETVMQVYESQGCCDNYLANEEYSSDGIPLPGSPLVPDSKPSSESGPCSSSNDIDFSWQPPTADSLQRQKEEMLSLSSEAVSLTQNIMNDLSSVSDNEGQTATNPQTEKTVKEDKAPKAEKNKKMIKPTRIHKSSTSTSSTDKKLKKSVISPSKSSKHSPTDKHSNNASVGKKSLSSSESAKNGQSSKGAEKKAEKPQSKKSIKDENIPSKDSALLISTENVKKTPPKRQSMNKVAARDNGHNVNTPTGRPQMKKNMSDILQPQKSFLPGKKTASQPKFISENRIPSPKQTLDLNESVSMPCLNPTPSEIHQYVENWLEKVSPDQVPYTEETVKEESKPQTKVEFRIGGDSEIDENNECQTNLNEYYTQPSDALKKSASCLSVPLCHEPVTSLLHTEQKTRGLCVSMPSFRVDPVPQENRLRAHKSAEDINGPADNESSSSGLLSPKAKIKPVLQQLCSSIQCIRRVPDTHTTSNLVKSSSLPDFSTQVALVFGSSCKAFLSFLSVMTLRDSLTGSAPGSGQHSRSNSESMLMMESLQKISAIEDEEEQRASLTDLQSRASSQFRERWKDFLILKERLESEPLSPRVSETEFALDVVSEGGDVFEDQQMGLDELMEELNMPEDLRAEISSTIQQAKTFYPMEESTFVETDRNQSDSEDEVEQFIEQCNEETKPSPEVDSTCIADDITEKKQGNDNGGIDDSKQATTMWELEKGRLDLRDSVSQKENESVEREDWVGEDKKGEKDVEDNDNKEINNDGGGEFENKDKEREEETEDEVLKEDDEGQDELETENESGKESVEKLKEMMEEEITVDEEGEKLEGEKEVVKETKVGIRDEQGRETSQGDSVEETDEREFFDETEEEEKGEQGVNEEMQAEETEEEADEVYEEEEEVGNIEEWDEEEKEVEAEDAQVAENDVEAEMEEETDEGEKLENIVEEEEEQREREEEEAEVVAENVVQEEVEEVIEETEEEEEVQNIPDEVRETEEEVDVITVDDVEEAEEVEEETDEESKEENITEEVDEEDEEEIDFSKERDTEEDETEVVVEENDEEEDGDFEIENTDGRGQVITDEEEEKEETDKDIEEEEKCDESEESREEFEKNNTLKEEPVEEIEDVEEMEIGESPKGGWMIDEEEQGDDEENEFEKHNTVNEDSVEEIEDVEEMEIGESPKGGWMIDEEEQGDDEENEFEKHNTVKEEPVEEREDVEEMEIGESPKGGWMIDEEEQGDDEENELNKDLDQVDKQESSDEVKQANVIDDVDSFTDEKDCKNTPDTASYVEQHSGSCEEADAELPTKYSTDVQCEDDKGNGSDTVNELETDEGGERLSSKPHPVEISQELLDFVNSALQSSSLIFTYDSRGNVRIEPDNARVVHTKQIIIPKSSDDSLYGLNCLPSPSTSDLSDYRPETSESGGYQTQESVDIVSESGEEASEKPFPVCRRKTDIPNGIANVEHAKSELSVASNSEVLESSRLKSAEISYDSCSKASREDLSYFSAASSLKADAEAAPEAAQCISFASEKDSADGVLIDQGRWLLRENHLIRKSPPVSLGMYDNLDSTSIDTGQENASEDSPSHYKTQNNPLAAISSSELEEMAKPQTPKWTYYNMPHGSDSDPFLDDSSVKSAKKDTSSVKGRGSRVSPTIDTSKTWANKNGSLSSFASVEFKMPERRVHPEGEASAVTQVRRTSSGGASVLQAQDSLDTLRVRCGQYCPIL